ncbi:MAG: hypothetical protein ACREBU_06865 [Nitrososphaera sp.]
MAFQEEEANYFEDDDRINRIARSSQKTYRELSKTIGARPIVTSCPNAATTQVLIKGVDRHSLRIKNLHASIDVFYGESAAAAEDTAKRLTLWAKTAEVFELHIMGYEPLQDGRLRTIFHCEWDGPLFVRNPGAAAVDIETYEVY